jgi:hypothetical protein
MSILLGDNFSYSASKPLDGRLGYATLAEMKAVGDATMYNGCMAYCVETDKTYQWKLANTVDADTGRWREFSSGGGGSSDIVLTETLLAGGTSVTFTDPAISGNAIIDIYTDQAGLEYNSIDASVANTVTLAYDSQPTNVTVMLVIKGGV